MSADATLKQAIDQQTHRGPLAWLVSRQIFCGAGKVALIGDGQKWGFHISQRASFFETVIGLQTTHQRPLINTRDEPHADPMRTRRLHVIVGDSNLSEYSTYLKLGTFGLLLDLLQANQLRIDLTLADPIAALQQISEDPTCKAEVDLENGQKLSALGMQRYFFDAVGNWLEAQGDQTYRRQVWQAWGETLDALAEDPAELASRLDWAIKYEFLQAQMDKNGWDWSTPQIRELDFKYHLLEPQQGLFYMLQDHDLVDRLFDDEQVALASTQPPKDTRAHLRMACLKRYPQQIKAINWDTLVFSDTQQAVYRWRLGDPSFNGGAELDAYLQQGQLSKVVSKMIEKPSQDRRR